MTPEKAKLVAELMAERFPDPDVLLAESRMSVPSRAQSTNEANQARRKAAEDARIRWALSDTPQAIAMRRRHLDAMPVDGRDIAPVVPQRGCAA